MALVLFDQLEEGVARITLNDPESLNAMSEQMAKEFSELTHSLFEKRRKLKSIILTGSGRAFSAGGQLEMLQKKRENSGEENRLKMLEFYHSFLGILSLGVPLIAAINGPAVGAGLCLASACDIRVAADKAKLGFTFTKLGLHPGMGATWFVPRIVGTSMATELMITGRVIEAAEALQIGLVSRLVDGKDLLTQAEKVASEIASCGPDSVRQLLETLRGEHSGLAAALEREALCQSISYASAEFAEGVKAAIEKRKAKF